MKISLNWIADFVDLSGVNKEELINKFTLTTAEVDSYEHKGKDISNVVVGRILSVNEHPNSKKLHLLKVDNGVEVVNCVCGASNVRENMLVAFANIGATVVGGQIEKSTIAGFESCGMCCSKEELGLEEKSAGIWEITDNIEVGTDIKNVYNIEDFVFEVDNKALTNRPDLWGHYGIAREISAILGRPLKPLIVADLNYYSTSSSLSIKVETPNCLRYSGLKIGNISAKQSPENMQIRLYYCGMRAINLLADLTNYLMLEVGQPMHAFDGNYVHNIVVKEFDEPINFVTLDNVNRTVPAKSIVICNENEPIAIAGIMGGLNSEIKDDTSSIVLESATFDATTIRKTSMKMSHRTDASARYEKSLDPEQTITAISRFVHILRMIDENVTIQSGLVDVYRKHYDQKIITLGSNFISHYVGIEVSNEYIKKILTSLGFKVTFNGALLQVEVPSWRATKDITIPVDIVEEVARMYGYDNIEQKPVVAKLTPVNQSAEHLLEYDTKLALAEKFAFNEVHSYIWADKESDKNLGIDEPSYVKILNSTVKENDQIRSTIIPSLLKFVNENKNNFDDIKIFEIGRVVSGIDENKLCVEEKHLGIVVALEESTEQIAKTLKEVLDFVCEGLLNNKADLKLHTAKQDFVHPVNNTEIFVEGEKIGYFGIIHPRVKQNLSKKLNIGVMELDFGKLATHLKERKKINSISKYQPVDIDFNFVVDKSVPYAEIEKHLLGFKSFVNFEFNLKDIYQDETVLAGKKSYTFGYTISSLNHTLSGEEIEKFSKDLISYAGEAGYSLR